MGEIAIAESVLLQLIRRAFGELEVALAWYYESVALPPTNTAVALVITLNFR